MLFCFILVATLFVLDISTTAPDHLLCNDGVTQAISQCVTGICSVMLVLLGIR